MCVSPGTCACAVRSAGLWQTHGDVSRKRQNEHMPLSLQARGPGASLEGARGWPWLPRGTDQGGLQESLDIGGRWGLGVREPNEPPRSLSPGHPSRPTSRISGRSRKINSAPLWSRLLLCFSFSTLPFSADLINHACNTHTHIIFSVFLSVCLSFILLFLRQNAFQTKHDASHKGWESICVTAPWYGPLSGVFDKLLNMTAELAVAKIHYTPTVVKFNKLPLMSKASGAQMNSQYAAIKKQCYPEKSIRESWKRRFLCREGWLF